MKPVRAKPIDTVWRKRMGGDPQCINPQVPVDLVIDHSVQVDTFGQEYAFMFNVIKEFERNRERYEFLEWGQKAFDNFRVVPPVVVLYTSEFRSF